MSLTHTPSSLLIAVAAPSGAGKSSLLSRLIQTIPDLHLSVSYTTRPPRPQEKNGVNYFFVSESEFLARQQRGDFIESATVHGHLYGTSAQWLQEQRTHQKDVLLEIDCQGVKQLQSFFPDMLSIFILPENPAVQEERLKKRQQDSDTVIQQRLQGTLQEIQQVPFFEYVIVNRDFDLSLQTLSAIVLAARSRYTYQSRYLQSIFSSFTQ